MALPSVADDAVAGSKIAHEKAVDCGDDGDDAPASPNAGESLNQVGMGVQAVEGQAAVQIRESCETLDKFR